jgi:hypothetical protein
MQVQVEMFSWPVIHLAPGAEVRIRHWVVDGDGITLIDPNKWYSMSGVPDFSDVRVDRPVSEKIVELVAEGGWRRAARVPEEGTMEWSAVWRNPGPLTVSFEPTMLMAPAR